MKETLLSVEQLWAGYHGAPVVRNLNLSVAAGEVVALLGPNGAGKTTTLRAASGLLRPLQGRVTYLGTDVTRLAPHMLARHGLLHLPEDRGVFHGLTVAEHFWLGYRSEKLDVGGAYSYFPKLERLRTRRVGLLSGGEQQMLALARVLACHPKLLLLDELSHGLAPAILEQLVPLIRRYAIDTGAGVLIVEQHVEAALDVADHAYVLARGEIVIEGAAEDLRHDRHLLISSYLGEARADIGAATEMRPHLPGGSAT
jgi:ABC-type branched-subunit amino acid transport system ATPase component